MSTSQNTSVLVFPSSIRDPQLYRLAACTPYHPICRLQTVIHIASTMESLLTLSFASLSSRGIPRIRKGLRQIEGLLAQICLSNNRLSPHKRKTSAVKDTDKRECKQLRELRRDAAFREFFRLQEGFKWNGTDAPDNAPLSYRY